MSPPGDVELMLWVDGELDPHRAAEVEEYVASDPRARAIVAALRLGSEVVAADALRRAEAGDADSIVDNVMDLIEADASRRLIVPARRAPAWRGPAAAATGLLVAMAAAWVLFFKGAALHAPQLDDPSAGMSFEVHRTGAAFDDLPSASIDVVDFGARPGTIFYVPSEGENAVAVVWLTEDESSSGP